MPRPIQYGQRAKLDLDKSAGASPASPSPRPIDGRQEALRETVLDNIGRPDDLLEVDVRGLWDSNHYRVNVYRSVKHLRTMTDSYFVYMVEDGIISSPPMERRYHDDMLARIYADRPQSSL